MADDLNATLDGSSADGARDERGLVLAAISNAMVRMYKEQFGRGPTKVRTYFAGRDIVISVLRDTFTPAERRLVEMGEEQRMRDTRLYFQYASEQQFREVIEEATGRKVESFISGIDVGTDVSAEMFVLEPREG